MSLLTGLRARKGATSSRKRVGRGNGSGLGGTSGKGHKGQKARTGGRVRWGFEGGQTPLMRRLPKFGFTNTQFKNHFDVIGLDKLNAFDGTVSPETLKAAGLLKHGKVKVLANGSVTKALVVKAHHFSAKAKEAIETAGGKVEVIE